MSSDARRPLANPYGLSTWRGAAEGEDPAAQQPEQRAGAGRAAAGRERHGARRPAASASPASPSGRRGDGPGAAPGRSPDPADDPRARQDPRGELDEEPVDPPELPRRPDPFELARRTVNRSRAAAMDRGLYPISKKTQARDARDRSSRAPGYSGARPDPRDPQGVELVMRRVLSDLGWSAGMNSGRVLEEWDSIVGDRIASHCRPVSFDDGVLVVSADSSAWAAQLRQLTPHLITTIEEHVGAHVISELTVTGPAAAQRTWKKGRRTVSWRGPRDTYG